jgi:hypothetical protein
MAEPSRLCLILERSAEEIHEPEFVSDLPLVSFEAFVPEHRVFGWIRLDAERLTDLLNAHEELRLLNVKVEDLDHREVESADEAVVRRVHLVAVRASGPRGAAALRAATRTWPVLVESGLYRVCGNLHVAPDGDAASRLRDPAPMVPLTDAWIEYRSGGDLRRWPVGTIIVNRELASRIDVLPPGELLAGAAFGPVSAGARA